MWYTLLILCFMSLSSCGLLLSKVTLHNPVAFYLFPVKNIASYFMVWKIVCVNNDFHTASRILTMEINKLCGSHARICPSLEFLGRYGNANIFFVVDRIFLQFGRTTVIGGLLDVVNSCGSLGMM